MKKRALMIVGIVIVVGVLLFAGFQLFKPTNSENTNPLDSSPNLENSQNQQSQQTREFNMTAKRFEFNPSTITVNQGDRVVIRLTSLDVEHGFSLPEYQIDQKVKFGEEVIIEFTADKAGTFEFHCSVFCGIGHGSMRGTLIVKA